LWRRVSFTADQSEISKIQIDWRNKE